MEYLNKSKICREFLNQYSDTLFPELLPKLIKVAIYALHKTFHKWNFSMQEVDQFINCCYYKNRNLDLESQNYADIDFPCPPCKENSITKINPIQKLNMGFRPPEGESNSDAENGAIDCYGYGKFYPNDNVYVNEKNNFYDENYYIPRTHSYRNIQLYHKRLNNPKFITQEKNIYPHWWWNLKDDIEQDDYSENDSDVDHIPNRPGRFPKNIEEKLKKRAKRNIRYKSYNSIRPRIPIVTNRYYDESKIFPNTYLNTKDNDNDLDNSPYRKRDYSPFRSDAESQPRYGGTPGTPMVRLGRPIPTGVDKNFDENNKTDINPPNDKIDNNNTLSGSPLYSTSPNLNYRPGTGNPLGIDNRIRLGSDGFQVNNGIDNIPGKTGMGMGDQGPYNPNGQGNNNILGMGTIGNSPGMTSSSYLGTNSLKSQIVQKRNYKQSTLLSFDKDFNVNGVYKKVKGQAKKGLKYSLSGNQLKEDKKGIKRRKKE